MPDASLQKAKEPEKVPWHPLKIEPRRLVITADKPTATFKVKNRADYAIAIRIEVPDMKMWMTRFEDLEGGWPDKRKKLRSQEIVEVHLNLTPSEMEKLKKEGILKDEEIRVEFAKDFNESSWSKELIKVAFSDKEISEEEREEEEKRRKEDDEKWPPGVPREKLEPEKPRYLLNQQQIPWNPLKIAPRRLVITAEKPTAVFKMMNGGDCDVEVHFVEVDEKRIKISLEEMTLQPNPSLGPLHAIVVRTQEILEVHLNLTPSEMDKLKKEGILKDEKILVRCMPIESNSLQVEKLILAFSDKDKREDVSLGWTHPCVQHVNSRLRHPAEHQETTTYNIPRVNARLNRQPNHQKTTTSTNFTVSKATVTSTTTRTTGTTSTAATASTVTPTTTSTPGTTGTPTPDEEKEKKKKKKKCVIM